MKGLLLAVGSPGLIPTPSFPQVILEESGPLFDIVLESVVVLGDFDGPGSIGEPADVQPR